MKRTICTTAHPVTNLRMKAIDVELQRRAAWTSAVRAGQVTAYRIGDTVTVRAPDGTAVPAGLPAGSTVGSDAFGTAYAGALSGWTASSDEFTFTLPASPGTAPAATADTGPAATAPAPDATIPAGVTEQVPYTPDS
ncbi:hypothetical protein [Streptomyces echinatus]|uniref:hypothetical protein n=1 Tax=Streptomyces echinatus TaxID=67293 RepID=UPI0037B4E0B5